MKIYPPCKECIAFDLCRQHEYRENIICRDFHDEVEKLNSPASPVQQLKEAIALVRDAGAVHLEAAIVYEDFCRHLEIIEQRASI